MKKISHKLTTLIAGCFLGMGAIGCLSLYFLHHTAAGIRQAESRARVDGELYHSIVQSKDVLADVLPPPAYVIESYLVALQLTEATEPAERNRFSERLAELRREFTKSAARWKRDLPDGKLKEAFIRSSQPAVRFYEIVEQQLIPAVSRGDLATARKVLRVELLAEYNQQRAAIDAVVSEASAQSAAKSTELRQLLSASEREVSAQISSATMFTLIGSAFVMVAVGVMAALFSTTITRALRRTTASLSQGAEQVAAAANQVSSSSQSLAQGSTEQAASLEETSASLEEMAGVTKRNAESASSANQLASQARLAADTGATEMHAMGRAMQEIKTSSDDIAKIIKTIDEIAFQTNILALNAAVEAARAGEAGMGFAVVAEEVRGLAQRSAQAAKETAAKIEGAITKTAQGVEISSKVEANLVEIIDKVRRVDALVAEVATASREQSLGVGQLNTTVRQMDRVVQSNAAAAEESASAAEELRAQAASLQGDIGELLQMVDGKILPAQFAPTATHSKHPLAPKEKVSDRNKAFADILAN